SLPVTGIRNIAVVVTSSVVEPLLCPIVLTQLFYIAKSQQHRSQHLGHCGGLGGGVLSEKRVCVEKLWVYQHDGADVVDLLPIEPPSFLSKRRVLAYYEEFF